LNDYAGGMTIRLIHDTAFKIASVLSEKMSYKLVAAELEQFHRIVYETCKAGIEHYERQKERENEKVRGAADQEPCGGEASMPRGEEIARER
jgi:uncharacterized protein YecA (UPF0149 family)